MQLILEAVLAFLASLTVCRLQLGKKRKIVVRKDYVVVYHGKEVEYMMALEMERVDPASFVDSRRMKEYSKALARCCKGITLEIRVVRGMEDSKKLIKKIENEIATLRVILESDPSNVRAESKLRYYEKLLNIVSKYPLITVRVYYLLRGRSKRDLRREIGVLEGILEGLFGAEVRVLKGSEIAELVRTRYKHGNLSASPVLVSALPLPKRGEEALIYVGMRDDGEPVLLDFDDVRHHIAVFGSTGSGKTTLLCTLLKRLKVLGIEDIVVLDPKGDLLKTCGEVVAKSYGPFAEESLQRRKEAVRAFASEVLGYVLSSDLTTELKKVVVIDEAWLVDKEVLESLLREGRSRGVGVLVATHAPSDLGLAVLHNAHTKFFLRLDKFDEALEKLGVAEDVASLGVGEAIMVTRGGEAFKVKIEPESYALTSTTLKSAMPSSDSKARASSASPLSSMNKKLGTTLDL